jgi:hypothetical protein
MFRRRRRHNLADHISSDARGSGENLKGVPREAARIGPPLYQTLRNRYSFTACRK